MAQRPRRPLVSLANTALVALVAVSVLATPRRAVAADDESLRLSDLLDLERAGVPEDATIALIEQHGLAEVFGARGLIDLREAGYSPEFTTWIVQWQARQPTAPLEGIDVDVDAGVVRVSGHGTAAGEWPENERAPEGETDAPVRVVDRWLPVPVSVPVPPPADTPAADAATNPYPVGAAVGWSGSVVFLPARFGERPSAFGRTIVTTNEMMVHPHFVLAPSVAGVVTAPAVPARLGSAWGPARLAPVRTSRGILYLPN